VISFMAVLGFLGVQSCFAVGTGSGEARIDKNFHSTTINNLDFDHVCPVCNKLGLKSKVYGGTGTCTLMGGQYWDEQGNFVDPNICTRFYHCSHGHSIVTKNGKIVHTGNCKISFLGQCKEIHQQKLDADYGNKNDFIIRGGSNNLFIGPSE